jgi:hypothetical protein
MKDASPAPSLLLMRYGQYASLYFIEKEIIMPSSRAQASGLLLTIFLAVALVGCATTEKDWQTANRARTIEAYEHFLQKHPNSAQANVARRLLPQMRVNKDWRNAEKINTPDAYETFLSKHPQSKQANQATITLEALRFKIAKEKNTIAEYESYLKRHPGGAGAQEAELRLRALRYAYAKEQMTVAAIDSFLIQYSSGDDVNTLKEARPAAKALKKSFLLGKAIIKHFSKAYAPMDGILPGKLEAEPSIPTSKDLSKLRKLLQEGADPNVVNIVGFEPPGEKKHGGYVLLSPGNPGQVVRAEKGGMTLLDYCHKNKLETITELLIAHGAK